MKHYGRAPLFLGVEPGFPECFVVTGLCFIKRVIGLILNMKPTSNVFDSANVDAASRAVDNVKRRLLREEESY